MQAQIMMQKKPNNLNPLSDHVNDPFTVENFTRKNTDDDAKTEG